MENTTSSPYSPANVLPLPLSAYNAAMPQGRAIVEPTAPVITRCWHNGILRGLLPARIPSPPHGIAARSCIIIKHGRMSRSGLHGTRGIRSRSASYRQTNHGAHCHHPASYLWITDQPRRPVASRLWVTYPA